MDYLKRKKILESLDLLGVDYSKYTLPKENDVDTLHVIPVSGGSDSKAMALILTALFPKIRFVFVFTDTLAEESATYKEFDQISDWCGRSVIKIKPTYGLYDLIEKYGGFIPSGQARYCTRILKISQLDQWLEKYFKGIVNNIHLYVGIRIDEDRFGHLTDSDATIQMQLPFIDLNIGRSQVYGLLAATAGISPVYKHSSRSSCGCCFFKRNSERVMQCVESNAEFQKAAKYEKLCASDLEKLNSSTLSNAISERYPDYYQKMIHNPDIFHAKPVSLLTENEITPAKPFKKKKKIKSCQEKYLDQFSIDNINATEKAYVAVMFLVYPNANNAAFRGAYNQKFNGVYFTKFLNYSRSFHGLKRSLTFVFEQLISTAELYNETQMSMQRNLRIGLYEIEIAKGNLNLDKIDLDSYTWAANGFSYSSLQQNISILHWILYREQQVAVLAELKNQLSYRYKNRKQFPMLVGGTLWEKYRYQRSLVSEFNEELMLGRISWSGLFQNISLEQLPSEIARQRKLAKVHNQVESELMCLACTL